MDSERREEKEKIRWEVYKKGKREKKKKKKKKIIKYFILVILMFYVKIGRREKGALESHKDEIGRVENGGV